MVVGESPAVARRRLRRALRQAREANGLTQGEVAASLEWSLSKVNRIEAGEVTVSNTDLQALLRLFGITDRDQVDKLMHEARVSRRRGWWNQPEYREHLTPAMIQSLQFESDASAIYSFHATLIPGLLQTQAYASAVIDTWSNELSAADRTTRLKVRAMRRDQLFSRQQPPDYQLVLDESVLRREIGGPVVMSEQLHDLLDVARAGQVAVRVLPLKPVTVYTIGGLFVIYAADDDDVALYQESHLVDDIVYTSESLRRHRRIFERMWRESMTPEASMRLIEARAAAVRLAIDIPEAGLPAG